MDDCIWGGDLFDIEIIPDDDFDDDPCGIIPVDADRRK